MTAAIRSVPMLRPMTHRAINGQSRRAPDRAICEEQHPFAAKRQQAGAGCRHGIAQSASSAVGRFQPDRIADRWLPRTQTAIHEVADPRERSRNAIYSTGYPSRHSFVRCNDHDSFTITRVSYLYTLQTRDRSATTSKITYRRDPRAGGESRRRLARFFGGAARRVFRANSRRTAGTPTIRAAASRI